MNFIVPSNLPLNSATFMEKNFPDWNPVFCPVSGICTSDGCIWRFSMQVNSYCYTNSSIKFPVGLGFRFSVQFPVFVLLMVVSMYFFYIKISFVLLIFFSQFIVLKRIFRLVLKNITLKTTHSHWAILQTYSCIFRSIMNSKYFHVNYSR